MLLVPILRVGIIAPLVALAAGCSGPPDLDAGDPLVVTETGQAQRSGAVTPERAAAIAEMRAKARAAETAVYPEVFQGAQTRRLAARSEPRPVRDVEAIQVELAALAQRRNRASDAGEIAALEARAVELRRLARQAGARIPPP